MVLNPDDHVLHDVARGGTMDYSKWPELLPRVINRLEQIVRNEFHIPRLPVQHGSPPPSSPPQFQTQPDHLSQDIEPQDQQTASSQNTDKENAPPALGYTTDVNIPLGTLPPQILALLSSITQNLTTYFTRYPPHTIQRLSELVLFPKRHYRTLPSYLHAVDRVVHVTSGANIYPLPAAIPDALGAKILSNGLPIAGKDDLDVTSWTTSTSLTGQPNLGSDESLGGALLTPIPWLRTQSGLSSSGSKSARDLEGEVKTESTETIDGPNGAGSIETVSVSVNGISSTTLTSASNANSEVGGGLRAEGGVTQGELLRQEQRAGVVPAAQLVNHRNTNDGDGEDEEAVHARGPDEIGMEDMGPQSSASGGSLHGHGMQGIDVEAAVGRRAESNDITLKEEDVGTHGETGERIHDEQKMKNEDEEMILVDADGKDQDQEKIDDQGETAESHVVDR